MLIVYSLFLMAGFILAVFGAGNILRFLSWMTRGVGMNWATVIYYVVIGSIFFVIGLLLILHYFPLTLEA
jgi:hypothetical protein